MKNKLLSSFIAFLFSFYLPCNSQGNSQVFAEEITLVADEWCPYNCAEDSANPGILIEIAKAVFETKGYKVSYKVMPWSRAISESRDGKFNAIVGAAIEDAPDFIFPEKELTTSTSAFFVKKANTWKYQGIESLKSISLGAILDYAYGIEIEEYIKLNEKNPKSLQLVGGEDALQKNIKKLLADRIDALIEDEKVFENFLKGRNEREQIKAAGKLADDKIYIAFSPNIESSKKFAKELSDGLIELQSSGAYKAILDRY